MAQLQVLARLLRLALRGKPFCAIGPLMSAFTILLGGELTVTPRVQTMAAQTRVIAADGGMRHAAPLNLEPELWVGDFDSTNEALLENYRDVPRQHYDARKASTDGEIAVDTALERSATSLTLIGAIGGVRTDHALAHLLMGVALAKSGIKTVLTSGEEEAYPLLPGEQCVDLPPDCLFSVLALSDLSGLDIANAYYPLEGFNMPFGASRTVSNVARGPVTFQLNSGAGIVLARPYDNSGV